MGDKNDLILKYYIMKTAKNIGLLAGLVAAGAVVGAAVGLLFAPDNGKNTRKKIADGTKDIAEDLKHSANDFKRTVEDGYRTFSTKTKNALHRTEREAEELANNMKNHTTV